MLTTTRTRLTAEEYIDGVLDHDRIILSRAITLIESSRGEDVQLAEKVLNGLLPHTGDSRRIGITGVPGVGKSTFIEAMGTHLAEQGHKLAVLAVDPSSQRSGGSILGDKTRMEQLSNHPNAYIRPSATGSSLGGVANKTREAMLLCEAAGFDTIFIETVGVGQSETAVKGMVDFFLLLMLAGAGDELQGIKKGIMEMADALVINKADGDNIKPAKAAKAEYQSALHLFPPTGSGWVPKVELCSATGKTGIAETWKLVDDYYELVGKKGINSNRKQQNLDWMHESIGFLLKEQFYSDSHVKAHMKRLERDVEEGSITPLAAARQLIDQV